MANIRLISTSLKSMENLISFTSLTFERFPTLIKALENLLISLPTIKPTFPDDFRISAKYTTRHLLEKKIQNVSSRPMSQKFGEYTIVVGPKGAGKSFVVARALCDKEGVVHILISQIVTPASFLTALLESCGKTVDEYKPLGLKVLVSVLGMAAIKKGVPVTSVLEVESGRSSPEVLESVNCIAKQLAIAANVVVILSEANAGLILGDDDRQQFIWVDEMTNEEAEIYARKIDRNVYVADLELLFKNIGKLPLKIGLYMTALKMGTSAAELVEQAVASALDDLKCFGHQPIIHALKASPNGVLASTFCGIKDDGVLLAEPKQVAVAMKARHAIVYHLPSREYRFATTAHRISVALFP